MIRLLLVELDPDDHDTRALARALRDEGAEVVYTTAGTADEVVITAAQEDVRAVGFAVRTDEQRRLAAEAAREVVVFATAAQDEPDLRQAGVAAVFQTGAADHVVAWAGKLG
ncbi:methylmalonyl-CoA mutase [Actinocrispum sp. NPDC049592]|uniref:methylmalonyl-CoA mutase n=1 Tax=Actinocrispum sp. NPDC049592 TaxID=3154835 RepID=UPI00342B4360